MVGPGTFDAVPGDPPKPADCDSCRNKTDNAPTCLAFPNGIPRPLLDGDVGHKMPFPGDNGVRYEPDPAKIEALRAMGWL